MTTVYQYNIFSSISWNFKMSHVLTFPDATNIIFGSNCLYFTMDDGWMERERKTRTRDGRGKMWGPDSNDFESTFRKYNSEEYNDIYLIGSSQQGRAGGV